jgi:spore germination protein YaaH
VKVKYYILTVLTFALLVSTIGAAPESEAEPVLPPPVSFAETWAYLMAGEEHYLDPAYPITDLCYFSAEVNAYGELERVPDLGKLAAFEGRKHLVVAEIGSYALTHFCLDPSFPIRDTLVASIIAAAEPFDGLQIDFESIPVRDRDNFVEFLRLLKAGLGDKALSVALPARFDEAGDVLGYARIAEIVDRVIVMAYDEHWSTSAPGPVASLEWCNRVAAYVGTKIPLVKLVMGVPFYGRAWTDKRLARAYKHSAVLEIIDEQRIDDVERESGVPWFTYEEIVSVTLYYDDIVSLAARLSMYRDAGVLNVAFWRLGQEDPAVWRYLWLE